MFTVTQVGSWPRSPALLRHLRDKQKGRISREEFERFADGEVRRCVAAQVDAGVDILVDGEQRRTKRRTFM
jgi:5-methyltetrahydropteroyltriglutamate--homocysteine methyltransferase